MYRFLGFFLADYKAYALYLKEQMKNGYELESYSKYTGIGKFKKVKPREVEYRAFLYDKPKHKKAIDFYQAQGMTYIMTINKVLIFEVRGDMFIQNQIIDIHELPQKKKLMRKEVSMVWRSVRWVLLGTIMLIFGDRIEEIPRVFIVVPIITYTIASAFFATGIYAYWRLRRMHHVTTLEEAKRNRLLYLGSASMLIMFLIVQLAG